VVTTCEYPINRFTNPNPAYKSLEHVTIRRKDGNIKKREKKEEEICKKKEFNEWINK
jgi:hypothetical protein